MKSVIRIAIWVISALILNCIFAGYSPAQTTLQSTYVHVNIGNPGAALFGFGPASSPLIGATAVFVGCGSDGNGIYHVYTNYGTPNRQNSGPIPLTCTITVTADPDRDASAFTSVVVTSAQSGNVNGQAVKLNNASYQSETVGGHSQSETLGGSVTLTINPQSDTLVGGGTGGGGH